jgi:hypothetical protein
MPIYSIIMITLENDLSVPGAVPEVLYISMHTHAVHVLQYVRTVYTQICSV